MKLSSVARVPLVSSPLSPHGTVSGQERSPYRTEYIFPVAAYTYDAMLAGKFISKAIKNSYVPGDSPEERGI